MKLSKLYFVFVLFIFSLHYTNAQSAIQHPRKIIDQDINNLEYDTATLDAFVVELQCDERAIAYIIIYGGKHGRKNEAKARGEFTKSYLVKNRDIDASRVFVIDGGYREKFHWEMWLVFQGKEPPKPTPTVEEKDVKFNGESDICGYELCEFYDFGERDMDEKAQLDAFAAELQNDPNKSGLIIVYNKKLGKKNKTRIPASAIKDYLTNRRGINPQRIVVTEGGYRDYRYLKMWFVSCSKKRDEKPNEKKIIVDDAMSSFQRCPCGYDACKVATCYYNEEPVIPYNSPKAILDQLAIELLSDPTKSGYIIVYAGKRSKDTEAKVIALRSKAYLINVRNIPPNRIEAIDGGYREKASFDVWLVSEGKEPPKPTPTLKPSEVKVYRNVKTKKRK